MYICICIYIYIYDDVHVSSCADWLIPQMTYSYRACEVLVISDDMF